MDQFNLETNFLKYLELQTNLSCLAKKLSYMYYTLNWQFLKIFKLGPANEMFM